MPAAPLPVRDGLNPTRIRLPEDGEWATVVEYLLQRFPDDAVRLAEKVAAGEVVELDGSPVTSETAYTPRAFIYLYRDPRPENRVPFEIEIVHRDENLLVIDKPHFLASTPRGLYITESAVVRLRVLLDLPELSPAHRLDRVTAGLLVFVVRQEHRGAYQTMFARREVHKGYEAIARVDPSLELPMTVRSHIIKERGTPKAREIDGLEPNAESLVELVDVRGEIGKYRLSPKTGKTHQLRLHMSSIGLPIMHDHFYPDLYDVPSQDYSKPLQLLAKTIAFTDPITGVAHHFESPRQLQEWPDPS
ncbi:pseudouridine synthase [Nakamurella antarctica]|uniref:RNA pseudouridylate synthase n=1 Tax=Nakamurella antarctica TaxID=1902245 RepID=A0A3G8ZNJ4_9ACTN|nr:pseudouridine synthase [Nakamurella antarctica]AZI58902.1 pseudouridine synthase [Nakamurella antarctica]